VSSRLLVNGHNFSKYNCCLQAGVVLGFKEYLQNFWGVAMGFSEAIKSCFWQFATFRGRACRSEFWCFFLFQLLCLVAASIVDRMLGTRFSMTDPISGATPSLGYGWVYSLVVLVLLLPSISVMVRRLHDTEHSGWWYWIVLVPLIGAILLLVWFCSRGTSGDNRFGHDPLAGSTAQEFA